MDFLSNIVQQVITVLYNMTATVGLPNYGLAIIIMTIIVKILLYPLTKKQIESTKAMMAMQPKMKAIQEKYKNDKQRLNMELANLYKQENVNPLAGCLPLLVQMPIPVCKSLSIFAENTRNGRTAENRRKIHAPRTKRGPQSVK